jgi:hypothetical protein
VKHFQTAGLLCAVTVALGTLQGDASEQMSVKLPFGSHGQKGGAGGNTTIKWHGGPVLKGTVPVYVIYYGTFTTTTTETIVTNFFTDLSTGSPQYDVNRTYGDSVGFVQGTLFPPMIALDDYSQGKSLGSSSIPKIIQTAIANGPGNGGLPADAAGVYFVVTAPDVKVSGFCTSFCAYHTRTTIGITDIKYALIPDPGQACTGCDGNVAVFHQNITPNGDMAADEMTDSIFHELSEAVTDPDLNAWYTSNGSENGDLCNYVYKSTYTAPNGSTANAQLGGHDYLIQAIWENVSPGFCASTYPAAP